jgi:hypothetical protein
MDGINIMLLFIVIFLSLYCEVLKYEPEPFQGIFSITRSMFNRHKRNTRVKIENMKTGILSKIKNKFRRFEF